MMSFDRVFAVCAVILAHEQHSGQNFSVRLMLEVFVRALCRAVYRPLSSSIKTDACRPSTKISVLLLQRLVKLSSESGSTLPHLVLSMRPQLIPCAPRRSHNYRPFRNSVLGNGFSECPTASHKLTSTSLVLDN